MCLVVNLLQAFLTTLCAVGQLVWIYIRALKRVECDLSTLPGGIRFMYCNVGHCAVISYENLRKQMASPLHSFILLIFCSFICL